MTYLNPWAIGLAAAAVALPVAIHLLTRPRPRRMPISTLRFIRGAISQRRARNRLRDAIVLALRALAVLLLGWTIARPMLGQRAVVDPSEPGDAVRVVLLDASASLAARERGIETFQRARAKAAEYLSHGRGLRANLIVAAANSRAVFEEPSANVAALRDHLADTRALPERLRVGQALELSAKMLAQAGEGMRRELVIVSDFQRSNWAQADFAVLPRDTKVQLESVAPVPRPDNVGILDIRWQGRTTQGQPVKLQIDVVNFSRAARQTSLEIAIDDATHRVEGLCPPMSTTTMEKNLVLAGEGWRPGVVRLLDVEDALALDNSRPVAVHVRAATSYLLVTEEPASLRPSASYYIQRALAPARTRGGGEPPVKRVSSARLDAETLAQSDLVVLVHPSRLSEEAVHLLGSQLRRGRPILYVASELADAMNLRALADAAGSGLNPPVELMPPPIGVLRRQLQITQVREQASPFQVFGDNLTATLASLRFSGGLASRGREGALPDDLLASYSDRSACLYVTSAGAGRLAVWNVELARSNLPTSAAFVPLLSELLDHLLKSQGTSRAAASGELLVERLSTHVADATNLSIAGPLPAEQCGMLQDEADGVVWHWPAAGEPGVYRVMHGKQTVHAVAVTLPGEESDLRSLDPQVLTERLASGRTVAFRSSIAGGEDQEDVWIWFAVVCVCCLLAEVTALSLFRT